MVPVSPFLEGAEMSHADAGALWPFPWPPPGHAYRLRDPSTLAVLHYPPPPVFACVWLALSRALSVS